MSPSIWQLLIAAAVALLLFGGKGKVSDVMGDLARGVRSFKTGLREDPDDAPPAPAPRIPQKLEAAGPAAEPASAKTPPAD